MNLAVPADPEGKGVKLEDCLEEYFNTKVDVSRDGVEEKGDRPLLSPRNTIRVVQGESEEEAEARDQLDGEPLQPRFTTEAAPESAGEPSTPDPERPSIRHRSTSIIQRIVLDDDGKPTDSDAGSLLQKAKKKGATVVKAVTIPAWQFFRLIPWHAGGPDSEPKTDREIVMHFDQRPVVGICLKRYLMTEDGHAKRHNTFIDIPDSLRLPHFMAAGDKVEEENSLSMEYKLVLQSVVCHRGDSVHSGHYISFARVNPKLLTDNRRHDSDPPPDYEDAQWAKFDDLALENRVSNVDDIKEALKQEMPYLLFYQIVPMVDVTNVSVTGSETEPPSYNDSTINVASTISGPDSDRLGLSRPASGYFEIPALSGGPSIRFSSELERPPRLSLNMEEDGHQPSSLLSPDTSRRGSVAFSEPAGPGTPALTPELGPSPAVTPGDESTAQRLSRAAAKFKSSGRSRPSSQVGESRISITISRLNLKSKSKEPLREAGESSGGDGEETPVATAAPERLSTDAVEVFKKDKDHHHHLYGRKVRQKSKSRSSEKDPEKAKQKGQVPDRECVVM